MDRRGRAFARLGWGTFRPGMRLVLLAGAAALWGGSPSAAQEAAATCTAINSGALNVELEAESRATRQAGLKAGDRLTFTFEAAPGPFGTLTLLQGAGAPRSLLVGPTGTSVSFVAAKGGAFEFEFSKDGAAAATFSASCAPSGSVRGPGPAARRSVRLLGGGTWTDADNFEATEMGGVVLDGVPAPSRSTAEAPWAGTPSRAAGPGLPPAGDVDLKLQWRGERYMTGPRGFEVDTTASGVDAAVNYKVLPEIMVGALAQMDQPAETLTGAPHGLFDHGWMAGPVTNVKLAPGLTLDARAAWGVAESTPDELSSHTASIPRRMVSARLANVQSFGPWRFTPSVSVNHFYEAAAAAPEPATAHDAAAPSAGGFGRVDVGPEVAYRIDMDKAGFIEPRAAVGTFWDFDSLSRLAPGTAGHNDLRLRAEAGVTIGAIDGTKLQAAGGVQEGETGTESVWSGRLQLSVPLR